MSESTKRGVPLWLKFVAAVLLLGVAVIVGGDFFLRWHLRQTYSPAEVAAVERHFTELVAVPPEWTRIAPITPDIERGHAALMNAWRTRATGSGDRARELRQIAENQWPAIASATLRDIADLEQEAQPVVGAYQVLRGLPGYDFSLLRGTLEVAVWGLAERDLTELSRFLGEYYSAAALARAAQGDWSAAALSAAEGLRVFERAGPATLFNEMHAHSQLMRQLRVVELLVAAAPDGPWLATLADRLERLAPAIARRIEVAPWLYDWLGVLADITRFGYPVDWATPRSEDGWFHEVNAVRRDYAQWRLGRLAPGDPRVGYLRMQLAVPTPPGATWPERISPGLRAYNRAVMLRLMWPVGASARAQGDLVAMRFTLVRQALRDRMAAMEGRGEGALLEDFYAGAGVPLRRNAEGVAYSVGPNRIDDGGVPAPSDFGFGHASGPVGGDFVAPAGPNGPAAHIQERLDMELPGAH